jgi:hypothetical protein
MPVETRAQRRRRAEAQGVPAVVEAPASSLLGLIFDRLPLGERVFTVGSLAREWRVWAARWRVAAADIHGRCTAVAPRWLFQETWPRIHSDALLQTQCLQRAAANACLDTLEWVRRRRACPSWNPAVCSAAAGAGQLEALQWLRARGAPWDEATCWRAAQGGHLALLQWCRGRGCDWSARTCSAAASGGHLAVLQWAARAGCALGDAAACAAARGGHLGVLRWACKPGRCPMDEHTFNAAAAGGHRHVLAWLLARHCYFRPLDASSAARDRATREWIERQPAWQKACRRAHQLSARQL